MSRKILLTIIIVPVLLVLMGVVLRDQLQVEAPVGKEPQSEPEPVNKPQPAVKSSPVRRLQKPSMQIDTAKEYTAVLTTSEGVIKIALDAAGTPITANNFVYLAREGFYGGTVFHRVIKDFMIQGGCPKGDGTGGPGYRFDDEPFEGEYIRGTVAMANSGPNTNGSQFFIMHQDYPLPSNYVIFGRVVEGLEVVDKVAAAPVEPSAAGEFSKPVEPVVIESVEIVEE